MEGVLVVVVGKVCEIQKIKLRFFFNSELEEFAALFGRRFLEFLKLQIQK